jgi:hypothetical protein
MKLPMAIRWKNSKAMHQSSTIKKQRATPSATLPEAVVAAALTHASPENRSNTGLNVDCYTEVPAQIFKALFKASSK